MTPCSVSPDFNVSRCVSGSEEASAAPIVGQTQRQSQESPENQEMMTEEVACWWLRQKTWQSSLGDDAMHMS